MRDGNTDFLIDQDLKDEYDYEQEDLLCEELVKQYYEEEDNQKKQEILQVICKNFYPEEIMQTIPSISEMEGSTLQGAKKLAKDVLEAAANLTKREARFLTNMYLRFQKDRIRAENQIKAIKKLEEPHSVLDHFKKYHSTLESQVQKILDIYTDIQPIGRWMKSIFGVGEVCSAGLLAHFDICKAPTAGHMWAFAGYDPTRKWFKKDKNEVGKILSFVLDGKDISENDKSLEQTLIDLTINDINDDKLREEVKRTVAMMNNLSDYGIPTKKGKRKKSEITDLDLQILAKLTKWTPDYLMANCVNNKTGERTRNDLTNAIIVRPFNQRLKTICYQLGLSFMSKKGNKQDFYGKFYDYKKLYYIGKNETGDYAHIAKFVIDKYNSDTESYKAYKKGKLPKNQIHMRSLRYAVKIFLSHLQQIWWEWEFKEKPPKSFPVERLGHAHHMEPINRHVLFGDN